jgi:hypothetical protein
LCAVKKALHKVTKCHIDKRKVRKQKRAGRRVIAR